MRAATARSQLDDMWGGAPRRIWGRSAEMRLRAFDRTTRIVVSPYPYKTAKEHYEALRAQASETAA